MCCLLLQDLGVVCNKAVIRSWEDSEASSHFPLYLDDTHSAVLRINKDASLSLVRLFPEVSLCHIFSSCFSAIRFCLYNL